MNQNLSKTFTIETPGVCIGSSLAIRYQNTEVTIWYIETYCDTTGRMIYWVLFNYRKTVSLFQYYIFLHP